jgi:hypothetical protein
VGAAALESGWAADRGRIGWLGTASAEAASRNWCRCGGGGAAVAAIFVAGGCVGGSCGAGIGMGSGSGMDGLGALV